MGCGRWHALEEAKRKGTPPAGFWGVSFGWLYLRLLHDARSRLWILGRRVPSLESAALRFTPDNGVVGPAAPTPLDVVVDLTEHPLGEGPVHCTSSDNMSRDRGLKAGRNRPSGRVSSARQPPHVGVVGLPLAGYGLSQTNRGLGCVWSSEGQQSFLSAAKAVPTPCRARTGCKPRSAILLLDSSAA